MYHFVHHNNDDAVFKGIPGLSVNEFESQINYLCKDHEAISHIDLVKYFSNKNYTLPEKCFYITFDEGLKQQYTNAAPILKKHHLSASFFIPTMPLRERKISLVEKQRISQYTSFKTYRNFLETFVETLFNLYPYIESEDLEPTEENIKTSRTYLQECDFYSDEERFYRKVRNEYLSPSIFEDVINDIFLKKYVSESDFINRYYMTWEEIREMENLKMVIGGHSHSHPMLDRIPIDEMKKEIDLSICIMNNKLKNKVTTYAYPYGTYNKDVTDYLQKQNILYSFATGNKDNSVPMRRYEIYRIDESSLNISQQ